MIASLRGALLYKSHDRMIIDVNGVGYEVLFSQATQRRLPETGAEIFIHIFTEVREDALKLYGFFDEEEKKMFLLLVKVSGVGPKLALNMLSGCGPDEIARALLASDIASLTRLPGIGKKTAERLCVELKDKVDFVPGPEASTATSLAGMEDDRSKDAISALMNLGYPPVSARKALETVQKRVEPGTYQAMSLEELLRQALRTVA